MILLGIDPGTAETGYGVIAVRGSSLRAVDHGVITTPAGQPLELRLTHIFAEVSSLIARHAPDSVALEDLFVGGSAVAVVGESLDDDGDPLGSVALVGDGLEGIGVLAATGRPGDRTLDVVFRH